MKKQNKILIFSLLLMSCKAQTIINITDNDGTKKNNVYYKDINNLLDPFIGTYELSSGNKIFNIILQKRIHAKMASLCFEDLIVGEYRYVDANGVEKINTLSEINAIYTNEIQHSIDGSDILTNYNEPICNNCTAGEKRLRLGFTDNYPGYIIIRRIIVNGQDAIAVFKSEYGENGDENGNFTPAKVPKGTYTLIKQL